MALLEAAEGTFSVSFHAITLGTSITTLGVLLHQHKIWVRMKDRVNELWRRHCKTTGDEFRPLENGKG